MTSINLRPRPVSEATKAAGFGEIHILERMTDDQLRTPDQNGWTAATIAAHYGEIVTLIYLKHRGISLNEKDGTGQTPMQAARANNQFSVMRHLMALGTEGLAGMAPPQP